MPASHPHLVGRGLTLIGAVLIAAFAPPVQAQTTYTWIPGSTFWQNAGSWSPGGGPPDLADIAEFPTGTTGTDAIKWNSATGDREVDQLHFLKGDYGIDNQDPAQYELVVRSSVLDAFRVTGTEPTFSLGGLHLKVTNSRGVIGDGATFNVDAGSGGVPGQVTIASSLTSEGTLNILGGSSVSNAIGYLGFNAGSTGTATVTGGGSQWSNSELRVGIGGTGILSVEGGGVVTSTFGIIGLTGLSSNGTGTATVTGDGSQWNSSNSLSIGNSSTGTLNVEDGGVVSNSIGYVGRFSGSTGTVTVTGSGSQWANSSDLYIASTSTGTGTLNVDGGGVVSNSVGYLAFDAGSIGEATVTGGGSEWNSTGELHVGYEGTGTLNVEDGGVVENTLHGYIGVGSSSTGTATVTGGGSQWNNFAELSVGQDGTGTLNVEGGGVVSNTVGTIGRNTGSFGTTTVSGGGSEWNNSGNLRVGEAGTGTMNVADGGVVSNTVGYIGNLAGSTGTTTVSGGGSQWNNSGTLSVGHAGMGTLNVEGGGVVSNTAGYLGFETGSTGTATVTGNGSQWSNSGSLLVGYSGTTGTLNVEDGGVVANTFGFVGFDAGSGTATVTGTDSEWNNSSNLFIGGSTIGSGGTGTVNIETGGLVSVGGTTKLWSTGTLNLLGGNLTTHSFDNTQAGALNFFDGTLHVTGAGGTFDPGSGAFFAVDGNTPSDLPILRISDQASAALVGSPQLRIGEFNQGSLVIESGGVVSNLTSSIAADTDSTGTATVTGDGSEWNHTGGLLVGFSGTGTLNVEDGGVVSNGIGWIGQNPGSIGTATVTGSGSEWNNAGNLFVGGDLNGAGGTATLNVQEGGLVQVGSTFKIWTDGTVHLDGGTLELNGTLDDGGGTFDFASGVMNVNDPTQLLVAGSSNNSVGGLLLGPSFVLGAGQTLNVAGSARVDLGGQLALGGGSLGATSLLLQPGGSVVNLANSSIVAAPVVALAGSQINVIAGDLTIGDSASVNGFYSNGTLDVNANTLTLRDANDAAFDTGALVALGDNGNPGTINAAGGLTLNFGGNIAGHGTVNTPDSPATPLINNGHITGNSGAEPITLSGYVKGVGTLDNVVITGTDAPGFSPATVVRGSVTYEGTLEIEIGGTSDGSFDQVNHILGAGIADLGGVLDVVLIDGFVPTLDDSFEIITATGGITGTFDMLPGELPSLPGGLEWAINYGANNVMLAVVAVGLLGDYNNNGTIDAADYTSWRDALTAGSFLLNDPTPEAVDESDFIYWRSHFGETLGSGATGSASASAAVPEPDTLVLTALCLMGVLYFRNAR